MRTNGNSPVTSEPVVSEPLASEIAALGEFELIARYFSNIGNSRVADVAVGDDCALLTPPAGEQLAISVDTLVADVHFPAHGDAYFIAQKALRCNLSDLAAMGAKPLAFTLALSLPQSDEQWIAEFSRGLRDCANEFDIALIGGDTTRNPVATITIQVMGTLPIGSALLRSGAEIGDAIYVSGTLGDARAALDLITDKDSATPSTQLNSDQQFYLQRYYNASPRVELGIALRDIANSAIDISDGLAADLDHILERSQVGAEINLAALPLSTALRDHPQAREFALGGGDDYELCFTVPQCNKSTIEKLAKKLSLPLSEIGVIVSGKSLSARDSDGILRPLESLGYQHF